VRNAHCTQYIDTIQVLCCRDRVRLGGLGLADGCMRFVCVIRVPMCARVSRVCPGSPMLPPVSK